MDELLNFFKQYFYFETLDKRGAPVLALFFLFLLVAESRRQLRRRKTDPWKRIKSNLGLTATALLVIRLALIPVLVLVAKWAQEQ